MLEDPALKERVLKIYDKLGVRSAVDYDPEEVFRVMQKDKKVQGETITVVKVKEPGKARLEKIPVEELRQYLHAAR